MKGDLSTLSRDELAAERAKLTVENNALRAEVDGLRNQNAMMTNAAVADCVEAAK